MEFKVFTLNCWGIPFISKDKDERMEAIASYLSTTQYDVVCLQEVWTDIDFYHIRDKVTETLPHAFYFYSGVIGSGICILSKHPIVKTHFHKWMMNGYVHKIHHGDWFGGKGVGLCQIKYKHMLVNVYSAHLHAEYNRDNDEYYGCRLVQAYETAQFIQLTSSSADIIFLAGDLNCEPGDLAYRTIVDLTSMRDSVQDNDHSLNWCTNFDLRNTYTPKSYIKAQKPGVRIDYILYKSGSTATINLLNYNHPLPDYISSKSVSYSDHEAITSTFVINRSGGDNPSAVCNEQNLSAKKAVLNEGISTINNSLHSVQMHRIYYWICTIVLFIIILLTCLFVSFDVVTMHFIRILLSGIMFYTLIMASLWNMIEFNSLYAAKLGMEVYLNGIENE